MGAAHKYIGNFILIVLCASLSHVSKSGFLVKCGLGNVVQGLYLPVSQNLLLVAVNSS